MKEYYVIYLRKSRSDNEFETVEEVLYRHEKQLQEYAAKTFGHRIPEEDIYREVVSGETIEDRPEIKKVLKRMEDPNCKGILVIEPQRLTRGDLLDCGTIVHAFRYTSTLCVTPTKTYNLEEKYDRKFFEMELTRGNDYLEYIKEILGRGREASVREGNYLWSIPPFGYDRFIDGKTHTLVINEKEAEVVRLIFHLYAEEGLGANLIAQRVNALGLKPRRSNRFGVSAIYQIVSNEVYIGKIRWGHKRVVKVFEDGKLVKKRPRKYDYELIDGKHQPIISEELFQKAQEHKGKVTKEKTTKELRNMWAGLIKCKKCGLSIAYRPYKGRKDRYYCRSGVYCENKSCNVNQLDYAIIQALKMHLEDFKIKISGDNKEALTMQETILKRMEKELADLDPKQEQLYEFLESGIYTKEVFVMRNEKLEEERKRLKETIEKTRQNMPSLEEYEQKYYSLHQALSAIENPNISAKAKNALLKEIIDVIYYEKDENDKIKREGSGLDISNIKLEIILK